jgi:hypothetical protein
MEATDKPQFLRVLNGIAAIKKSPLVIEAIELWWVCMHDWSIEDFQAATIEVLKRTTYMPCPKDFEDLRRAGRTTAGEAWDQAVRHAASSSYRLGPLGDATIDQCARMLGGYAAIANCNESALHYLERRFTEHYEAVTNANEVRQAIPQVAQLEGSRLRLNATKKLLQ